MRIGLVHHSLNIPGGAERLCLAIIEALRNKGHNVTLVTVEKTDWAMVQNSFDSATIPNNEIYLTKSRVSANLSNIPFASIYFLTYIMQLLIGKSKRKYDLTINSFGDIINSVADITYIHFPLRAALEFSQVPAFSNRSIWQAVDPIYNASMRCLDKIYQGELLTNSKFMQDIITRILNRKPHVVYPPVNVKTFSTRCFRSRKAGHKVAIVASYTSKRHLEQIPLIAKHTESAKFVIIGKADEYSLPTLKKLRELINILHVEDRVTLLTNVPFTKLLEILSQAKVYLHTMPYDHFGISLVEAMASGCVPVVHRSGGPWLDILDGQQGNYGLSYTTPEEAADHINTLISDEDLRSKMASRALYRAKRFDRTVFMKKMVEVVEQVAS